MPAETPGLRYPRYLLLGFDEMAWLQAENNERAATMRKVQTRTAGLVVPQAVDGTLGNDWRVHDDDDDGTPTIVGPALGIDDDGNLLVMSEDERDGAAEGFIDVPDDATWYTLVVRRTTTYLAPGTLDLTVSSATITGNDTDFTRFTGRTSGGFSRGTVVYIDPTDSPGGNGGYHELDVVTDGTNAAFVSAVPGSTESDIPFYIAGQFDPVVPADRKIHVREILEFELVAQTLEPAAGDFVICDIKRDSGGTPEIEIRDRRKMNLYRPRDLRGPGGGEGLRFDIPIEHDEDGGGGLEYDLANDILALSATGYRSCAIAHAWNTSGLTPPHPGAWDPYSVVIAEEGTDLKAWRKAGYTYGPGISTTWTGPVTISTGGAGQGCGLVLVPRDGATPPASRLLAIFSDGTDIYQSQSDDSGSTWTTPVAIWTAGGSNAIVTPMPLLLRNGRLIVAGAHWDGATQWGIHLIYSDDFGTTWNTNAGAGWTIHTQAGTPVVQPYLAEPEDRSFIACVFLQADLSPNYLELHTTTDKTALASWSEQWNSGQDDMGGDPAMWISPENEIAILYNTDDPEIMIRCHWLGYNEQHDLWRSVDFQRLMYLQTGAASATYYSSCYLMTGLNGHLEMAWVSETTPSEVLAVTPLVPRRVPRSTWPHRPPVLS